MTGKELIAGLPGEELVRAGLVDLQAGRRTVPACLAAIMLPRLRRAALIAEVPAELIDNAELALYRLLLEAGGDAYSRYNALLRELVSFESALDLRCRKFASG